MIYLLIAVLAGLLFAMEKILVDRKRSGPAGVDDRAFPIVTALLSLTGVVIVLLGITLLGLFFDSKVL
jgi:hypothetical protein